jgi:mRNA-degrading endonuclease RelE of RelBE toxin-antitoxin system
MTEGERETIVNFIAENPDAGDPIQRSGGCRKLRFGGKGKGKRGGFRVITFYSGASVPVFLLTVYAKGSLSNLADAQVNILKALTKTLLEEYARR